MLYLYRPPTIRYFDHIVLEAYRPRARGPWGGIFTVVHLPIPAPVVDAGFFQASRSRFRPGTRAGL